MRVALFKVGRFDGSGAIFSEFTLAAVALPWASFLDASFGGSVGVVLVFFGERV